LLKYTSQIKSIDVWLLLQIAHDVSVFVPGIHQAKGGDGRRHPIWSNQVLMFKLHHHIVPYFAVHPLSKIRMKSNPPQGSHGMLTFLNADS